MRKERLHIKESRGFSLVEIIVSAGLLLLLAILFIGAVTYGEDGAAIAGAHTRATFIAEEGIEAARNIRDQAFTNLVNGSYGISTTTGAWSLSGTSDTQDIFTRTVTVATVDSATKQITSTVTWPEDALRTGSVSVVTYLTNTKLLVPSATTQASYLMIDMTGSHLTGGSFNQLQGITVQDASTSAITIDKITLSWTPDANTINAIQINGSTVWSSTGPGTPTGSQSSGTALDISNVVLSPGAGATNINYFQFSGAMTGDAFTIIFAMTDGSTKTATTSP
jgi:hypothetical protein